MPDKLKDLSKRDDPAEIKNEYLNSITSSPETPDFSLEDFENNFGESFYYKIVEETDPEAAGGVLGKNKKKHVGKRVVVGYIPPTEVTDPVTKVVTKTYEHKDLVKIGYFPVDESGSGDKTDKFLSFMAHMYGEFASDINKAILDEHMAEEFAQAGVRYKLTDLEDEIESQINNSSNTQARLGKATQKLADESAREKLKLEQQSLKIAELKNRLDVGIKKTTQKIEEADIKALIEKVDIIDAQIQDNLNKINSGMLDKKTLDELITKNIELQEDLTELEKKIAGVPAVPAAPTTSTVAVAPTTSTVAAAPTSTVAAAPTSTVAVAPTSAVAAAPTSTVAAAPTSTVAAAPTSTVAAASTSTVAAAPTSAVAGTVGTAAAISIPGGTVSVPGTSVSTPGTVPGTPGGAPAGTPGLSATTSAGPVLSKYNIVSERGPLSYKAYLEKVGVPKEHLDKVEDYGGFLRKKGSKKLKSAAKKYEKLLEKAKEVQKIYGNDPTLAGMEPWDLATKGIKHKNAKKVGKLVKDMENIEKSIMKELDAMKGKGVDSREPTLVGNAFWTDALMGKKYDAAAWAAKSSRLSTLSGSNSLASTTASVSPQGDEILIGEEELITKIDLNEKSVYTLIDMYQNPDSDFDKMDVLKRALAGKLLVAGSYLDKHANGTLVKTHIDLNDVLIKLGNGSLQTGRDEMRKIVGESYMTEEFQKTLNAKYSLWKDNAANLNKQKYKGAGCMINHLKLPNPRTDDAIMANAFVSTMASEYKFGCKEMGAMLNLMKDKNGPLEASEAARYIRKNMGSVTIGDPSGFDTWKTHGLSGLAEGYMNDWGVSPNVKGNVTSVINTTLAAGQLIAKVGAGRQALGGVWQLAKAGWYTITRNPDARKIAWKAALGKGKKAAIFLGGDAALGLLGKGSFEDNSLIGKAYTMARGALDTDYAAEIAYQEELASGVVRDGTLYTKMARDNLGQEPVSQLLADKVILPGSAGGIKLDVAALTLLIPSMQGPGVTDDVRQDVANAIAKRLMVEYPFTYAELSAIPTGWTLQKYMDSYTSVNNSIAGLTRAFTGTGIKLKSSADIMRMSPAEQAEYFEKAAFAAQQSNKLLGPNIATGLADLYGARQRTPFPSGVNLPQQEFIDDMINPALKIKDMNGLTAREAMVNTLNDVLTSPNPDAAIQKYFNIVGAALGGNDQGPLFDTGTPPKPQQLYHDGTNGFADYLHDATKGNGVKGGRVYHANPTKGASAKAALLRTPFKTATQSWLSL